MRRVVLAAWFLCIASAAGAQTSQPDRRHTVVGQTVECAAFKPEPDGSWTAVKPVPVQRENEAAELQPGAKVVPGGPKVVGIDVAAMLNAACR